MVRRESRRNRKQTVFFECSVSVLPKSHRGSSSSQQRHKKQIFSRKRQEFVAEFKKNVSLSPENYPFRSFSDTRFITSLFHFLKTKIPDLRRDSLVHWIKLHAWIRDPDLWGPQLKKPEYRKPVSLDININQEEATIQMDSSGIGLIQNETSEISPPDTSCIISDTEDQLVLPSTEIDPEVRGLAVLCPNDNMDVDVDPLEIEINEIVSRFEENNSIIEEQELLLLLGSNNEVEDDNCSCVLFSDYIVDDDDVLDNGSDIENESVDLKDYLLKKEIGDWLEKSNFGLNLTNFRDLATTFDLAVGTVVYSDFLSYLKPISTSLVQKTTVKMEHLAIPITYEEKYRLNTKPETLSHIYN